MIESTALFLCLTFLAFAGRYFARRRLPDALIAVLAGSLGAAVKPPTVAVFVALAGIWWLQTVVRARPRHWAAVPLLGPLVVLLPFGAGWLWQRYADSLKAFDFNPLTWGLASRQLFQDWIVGPPGVRFHPSTWATLWESRHPRRDRPPRGARRGGDVRPRRRAAPRALRSRPRRLPRPLRDLHAAGREPHLLPVRRGALPGGGDRLRGRGAPGDRRQPPPPGLAAGGRGRRLLREGLRHPDAAPAAAGRLPQAELGRSHGERDPRGHADPTTSSWATASTGTRKWPTTRSGVPSCGRAGATRAPTARTSSGPSRTSTATLSVPSSTASMAFPRRPWPCSLSTGVFRSHRRTAEDARSTSASPRGLPPRTDNRQAGDRPQFCSQRRSEAIHLVAEVAVRLARLEGERGAERRPGARRRPFLPLRHRRDHHQRRALPGPPLEERQDVGAFEGQVLEPEPRGLFETRRPGPPAS